MSDTSLKRQLKVLTIPVFIEMALVMMLGAVDTVMLSRYSDGIRRPTFLATISSAGR